MSITKKFSFSILAIAAVVYGLLFFTDTSTAEPKIIITSTDSLSIAECNLEVPYSPLPNSDDYEVKSKKIKWGENLDVILRKKTELPDSIIYKLIDSTKSVFDLRNFKANCRYELFSDSLDNLRYIVYKHSITESIILDIDSVKAKYYKIPTKTVKQIRTATIESSLWNAMIDNNINPMVANELSEIYAWTVDFFGLQKGDSFTICYDEEFADTVSVAIKKVYSAVFEHNNEKFYAFSYSQNGNEGYWDENGKSLKKSFLKAPLKYARISSKFSNSRFHPVLRIYRPHSGIDYAAPSGTPVYSVGDGEVVAKGYSKSAGNYVKIKHNSVYTTQYNHFSRFAKGLQKGQRVKQKQLIGYVGKTGYATGSHLDYRVFMNGKAVNPLKVKAPPVDPIKAEFVDDFNKVKQHQILELGQNKKATT